ncbi:MAG TPA: fimbria/pilus periplasmic chaperone [Candidatus Macondimonas sp.]|mgnify:CR=1 FL=1|nr:fimbria/pilus periplasmic chaperone [Candidatus Macondimonas sp.]
MPPSRLPTRLMAGLLLIGAVLAPIAARAGGQAMTVMPVTLQFAPGQRSGVLTLTNQGAQPAAFQIRAYAWDQAEGIDRLTPSTALVVSPPLGSIAPGVPQTVRLVLKETPRDREASYRILVDQIPPPAEPGVVGFALRFSLPIFVPPPIRIAPQIRWSIVMDQTEDAMAYLVAENTGGQHAKILEAVLITPDGATQHIDAVGQSPYVLAQSIRRWPIPDPGQVANAHGGIQLKGRSDAGAIDQMVTLRAPP